MVFFKTARENIGSVLTISYNIFPPLIIWTASFSHVNTKWKPRGARQKLVTDSKDYRWYRAYRVNCTHQIFAGNFARIVTCNFAYLQTLQVKLPRHFLEWSCEAIFKKIGRPRIKTICEFHHVPILSAKNVIFTHHTKRMIIWIRNFADWIIFIFFLGF